MEIRTMQLYDYEEVMALWSRASDIGVGPDDSRSHLGKYLHRNPGMSFVALENDRIVGAVMAGHDGYRGFIHHTAVDKEHRGKGIGEQLVRRAIEAIHADGVNKVVCVAFKSNSVGNSFWDKLGFTVRDDLYYRDLRMSN